MNMLLIHLDIFLGVGLLDHMEVGMKKKQKYTCQTIFQNDSTILHYSNNVLHFAFRGC